MPSDNFPHDAAYKAFFSNPDMVKSLLQDFVPEEFVKYFDFSTLEECSGSYITSSLQQRHDDIVWRVRWRDGWCYIYILLEFQSTHDYWMALRVLAYTALLWEDLIKQGHVKTGGKLPPVFPIVIYNGEGAWRSATNVRDLIVPLHDKLSDYQPEQKYFLIDENRLSAMLLDKATGESVYIFRLEQARTADEILAIAHELAEHLKDPKYDFLRRSIYSWISRLLRKRVISPDQNIDTVEDAVMLEQRIAKWEEELVQKGMLIGEEKGKAEGLLLGEEKGKAEELLQQKQVLLEMLVTRFDCCPHEWKKSISTITDSNKVRKLMLALLSAKTSEEFEKLLRKAN